MNKYLLGIAVAVFSLNAWAFQPEPPVNPEHPGSQVYSYELEREKLRIDGRDVEVFLPAGLDNAPVIVYGHGQAVGVDGYALTFEHLAKKGYAVIFPKYDSGFFDKNWKRMGRDFVSLTEKTLAHFGNRLNPEAVIFSGHSKGGHVALTAATVPSAENPLRPQALVLFNMAGYVKEWVGNLDPTIPVTITYSVSDTIIGEEVVREVYESLASEKKQYIKLKSYSDREADHFFPMSKKFFFGGENGVSAFHYYGVFKWLIGAADDILNKSGQTNEYVYGDLAADSGAGFQHEIERTWSDVLVYLDEQADLSAAVGIQDRAARIQYVYDQLRGVAKKSQKGLLSLLNQRQFKTKSFYISNAILVRSVTEKDQVWLQSLSSVKSLSLDVKSRMDETDTSFSMDFKDDLPTHIKRIKAHQVWNELGITGQGIVIAGQDTGYDWTHPAIRSQYRGLQDHNYNWFDATADAFKQPTDDDGHGTHTMGNMIGDGGPDRRIGVAPGAQWMGCRNMKAGVGTPSTYMSCFQFFLAPHPMDGDPANDGRPELAPHIVNNSWSCPASEGCQGEELLSSVRALKAAGIFVVVAAGNDGDRCDTIFEQPAMYSGDVFSVGAFNTLINDIAWFSSRGPSRWNGAVGVDIVAPGAPVTSSVPGGGYEAKMGTSMASPIVAGAVALLWSQQPELIGDIAATTTRLHQTATAKSAKQSCGPYKGGGVPNTTWGYGFLDTYSLLTK